MDSVVTLRIEGGGRWFYELIEMKFGYQQIPVGNLVIHEMDGFEGNIGVSNPKESQHLFMLFISKGENHNNRF